MTSTTTLTVLVMIPIVAGMIATLAQELVVQAEEVSEKTIDYADQMNNALDCAFKGIPITVCSPDLVDVDFDQDLVEFQETLEDIQTEAEATLNDLENTY